jgi:hypothetical protein
MFDTDTIKRMQKDYAVRAAQKKLEPFVLWDAEEVDLMPPFPFPVLGDHRPDGWELVEEWFCDSSGFGTDDEPALSSRQLKDKLKEYTRKPGTYGFGVTSVGQFQVYLGVFTRVREEAA